MNTTGSITKPNVFQNVESHKLMLAVDAAATIKAGQPVKLTATGTATPLLAADAAYLSIGNALHSKVAGEEVTIVMRGYMNILAVSTGALVAGPAKYAGWDNTNEKPNYVAASDAATTQAFVLEPAAGAGELVSVVIL